MSLQNVVPIYLVYVMVFHWKGENFALLEALDEEKVRGSPKLMVGRQTFLLTH